MGFFLHGHLKALGVEIKLGDVGVHEMDGQTLRLPPVILGRYGNDKAKKTVLVYGHYDVQPVSDTPPAPCTSGLGTIAYRFPQASKSDGWDTDPFTLVLAPDGRLIGRGSSDDKGPVLGWLNVLEAHKTLGLEMPVNLRLCFEGMEESGSEGLDDLIKQEVAKGKDGWFHGVDCVCIVSPGLISATGQIERLGPSRITTG
jgi:Cys-Gly metallodipeptidase DUG1